MVERRQGLSEFLCLFGECKGGRIMTEILLLVRGVRGHYIEDRSIGAFSLPTSLGLRSWE